MSRSAADIERDLGQTRAGLALTLEALEHKLAARHLVERGSDMIKDAIGGHDLVNRGLAAVRANPLPTALIGIGAAWLLASGAGIVGRVADRAGGDDHARAVQRRLADAAGSRGAPAEVLTAGVADRVANGAADGGASLNGTTGRDGNQTLDTPGASPGDGSVHQIAEKAAGAVRDAIRLVRDSGEAAIDRAGCYADAAGERATRIADQVVDTFEWHPLLIGAVGAMAGALIAALLPSTRIEDQWLGKTGDDLRNKAETAGREAIAQICDAAERSAGAAAEAVYQIAKEEAGRLAP